MNGLQRATSRRDFLQSGLRMGATAALAAPAAGYAQTLGSNDRISVGVIGAGDRGGAHIQNLLARASTSRVDITALCDVWQVNLNKAAEQIGNASGARPRTTTRFKDMLALENLDAVVIATPDFAHGPILIEAIKAGKDVYVEKPMTIEIALADEALRLAREKSRVVQAGTQRRSEGKFQTVRDMLAEGKIGKLNRVSVGVYVNQPRWLRACQDCKENDVDWDAYLFNRPRRPFDARFLRRWHLYKDYSNGLAGLWMTHFADVVNMITGASYPRVATANGGIYVWKEDREHCDTFCAVLDYPEEFLFTWTMGLGNEDGNHFTLHGTKGTIDVEAMTLTPSGGKGKRQPEKIKVAAPNSDHMVNWLDCIRSRQRPNADILYGHQHAVTTIMAAQAQVTGQAQRYQSRRLETRS